LDTKKVQKSDFDGSAQFHRMGGKPASDEILEVAAFTPRTLNGNTALLTQVAYLASYERGDTNGKSQSNPEDRPKASHPVTAHAFGGRVGRSGQFSFSKAHAQPGRSHP
jgi:hypothetical protein